MHFVKYQSPLILLLGLALNIASVYCCLLTLLFNLTINGLHLYGPALCFSFQNDKKKKKDRWNFCCIPPQDASVMMKEKIFASSVRSCTVYGPCIPRALSKAVGYPKIQSVCAQCSFEPQKSYLRKKTEISERMTLWSH